MDVTDVDILLGLAFKPTITVGFDFNDALTAEAFVSLSVPRLDAKLSTNAAANCGNSTNTTAPAAPFANSTTNFVSDVAAIGPLALVEANISLTVEVGVNLNISLLPPPFDGVGVEAQIFSIGFPLVTACANANEAFPLMTATVTAMPTPCNLTATNVFYKTENATQTSVFREKAPWSNHTITATVVEKGPIETHVWTPPPALPPVLNATATAVASGGNTTVVVPTPGPISFQPGGGVVMSSGFLSPRNATETPGLTPVQQTGAAFTGAATHGADVRMLRWSGAWQLGVITLSLMFGAVMVI